MAYLKSDYDFNGVAAQKRDPARKYASVNIVIIESSGVKTETGRIVFYVYGDSSKKPYAARWGDEAVMWAACPSPISDCKRWPDLGDPPPVTKPGQYGALYLSAEFIAGAKINAHPKWPLDLSDEFYPTAPLRIYPLSLQLIGCEMESGSYITGSIDLLDVRQASANQTIVLAGGEPVTIEATQATFESFYLPGLPSDSVIEHALDILDGSRLGPKEVARAFGIVAWAATALASRENTPDAIEPSTSVQQRLKTFLKKSA